MLTMIRSIHLYTGFGPRDRTQVEREYGRTVYGPDCAEYLIETCKGLIKQAVRRTVCAAMHRYSPSVTAFLPKGQQAHQDCLR